MNLCRQADGVVQGSMPMLLDLPYLKHVFVDVVVIVGGEIAIILHFRCTELFRRAAALAFRLRIHQTRCHRSTNQFLPGIRCAFRITSRFRPFLPTAEFFRERLSMDHRWNDSPRQSTGRVDSNLLRYLRRESRQSIMSFVPTELQCWIIVNHRLEVFLVRPR